MKEPKNDEPRESRDCEVCERQRCEYQGTSDEQASSSEQVGERAGRQLHKHSGDRRGAHDKADQSWAGTELTREERKERSAADRVAAIRDKSCSTQPDERSARRWVTRLLACTVSDSNSIGSHCGNASAHFEP